MWPASPAAGQAGGQDPVDVDKQQPASFQGADAQFSHYHVCVWTRLLRQPQAGAARGSARSPALHCPQCHLEGHFGSSGIYDRLEEVALKYAFLLHALSACPDGGRDAPGGRLDHAFLAAVALGILVLLGGETAHNACSAV
jgi:hypothetical protein